MKQFLRKLWQDEEGAEIVEWVIIVALLVVVSITGFTLLGENIESVLNDINDELEDL